MSNWIRLNPGKLNQPLLERIGGVELNVFVSPFDVPEAVRGGFDSKSGRFRIEFKYLTDEESEPQPENDHLILHIGKDSKRLLQIEIKVNELGADAVRLKLGVQESVPRLVVNGLERLSKNPITKSRARNYRVVGDVVKNRQEQLFAELAGST